MIVELLELVSVTVISVKEAVSEKAVTDCVGRVSTSETVVEECVDEGSYVESVMECRVVSACSIGRGRKNYLK
jgi:hypothetical protein